VPCQREVPAVAALQREFNAEGLAMIGIDLDDDRAALEAFGDKFGSSFPIAVEDEDRMNKAFGVRGCPATVIIDRKGRMVGRVGGGEGDWTSEAARALVRSLLGIRPAAAAAVRPVSAASRKQARKSVHLVSAVMPNDAKLNDILDQASDSLKAGDEVVILFDGPSVGALRMNMQKTPLEGAAFTSKQRDVVARRLGVPQSAAPRNQFEYIQQLAKAGAKVLVNANAIHAFGLADDEIHPLAKRIQVEEMEKMVDESDACLTYNRE